MRPHARKIRYRLPLEVLQAQRPRPRRRQPMPPHRHCPQREALRQPRQEEAIEEGAEELVVPVVEQQHLPGRPSALRFLKAFEAADS